MASNIPSASGQEFSAHGSHVTVSIVAISDTHSLHSDLQMEPSNADILIHAGDLTKRGTLPELEDVIEWLSILPYKHKIVIAGNHDIGLDNECSFRSRRTKQPYATPEQTDVLIASMKKNNIIYLDPDHPIAELEIRGAKVRIYGLPYSPKFLAPSAFMRERTEDTWAAVHGHRSYDILISHSPPRGILDETLRGQNAGCDHFLAAIERVKPLVVIFGHIHEARGLQMIKWDGKTSTMAYNVANLDFAQGRIHPPMSFTIDIPISMPSSKI